MTYKEAIKHAEEQLDVFGGEHREFIELAIEALEKQKTVDCDKCISEWCAICIHNKGLADCYMDLTNRLE